MFLGKIWAERKMFLGKIWAERKMFLGEIWSERKMLRGCQGWEEGRALQLASFDISRNTVCRYVRMYQDSGIPADKLPYLSDARLHELFAIPTAREHAPSDRHIQLEAMLPEYAARLSRKEFIRKGENLFITGCCGTGKSYLATALGYEACKAE